MSGIPVRYRSVLRTFARVWLMAGVSAWLSGCAGTLLPADVNPDPTPPPDVTSESEPAGVLQVEVPTIEPALAIIVGAEYAQFRPQSYVFAARLGRPYRLYELSARSPQAVLEDLKRLQPDSVIALGPDALRLAGQTPRTPLSPSSPGWPGGEPV